MREPAGIPPPSGGLSPIPRAFCRCRPLRSPASTVLGGTMRHTAAMLAVVCLALAGCSSGGEPEQTKATVTTTANPSVDQAAAKTACTDAWYALMTADGYDPDADPATPSECEGLPGQADLYMEALQKRNAEARARLDACTDDPSCTEWPVATP